jgi:hypothetical protein
VKPEPRNPNHYDPPGGCEEMTSESGAETSLSAESVIYYCFGIGSFPWTSFGTLTLDQKELALNPDSLLWTPRLQRFPIRRIERAEARPSRRARIRRFMWILYAALTLPTGLLGLPWLAAFWPRAGSATLEVCVRRWLFGGRRVFIVSEPEKWANAINRLIAANSAGEAGARGS